ncbi:MAG: 50S ribosomal protein L15 [Spirochaetes bacterium RBG_16_67_19]|nr:MAG: 50S ribosomal protein L15 [Spirochaetes bacterium GWB1_66_5]OHD76634.1 MAG: 50S ribosomal protein L15 [Spirochaetes bacterium RBG_16_67_19]
MSSSSFDIRRPAGATRHKKILGRGPGSGHGSTAGKGDKGQNARAGGGVRVGFEGGQMPLFRRVARRGFSNYPFRKEYATVKLEKLNVFADGEVVDRASLLARGLVRGSDRLVKILAGGKLERKLTVRVDKVSAGARSAIEAAGGSVEA